MKKILTTTVFILINFMMIIGMTACSAPTGVKNQPGPPNGAGPNNNQMLPGPNGGLPQISGAGTTSALPENQRNTISGSGTVAAGTYAKLYFGSSGKIAEINVKEGKRVNKGTVLARLDTLSLEAGVDQAKQALNAAKLSQIEANSSLSLAKISLDSITDVKNIQDEITKGEWELKVAQMQADESRALDNDYSTEYWSSLILQLNFNLAKKQRELSDLLGKEEYAQFAYAYGQKYDRLVVENARIKELAVESAKQLIAQSQDSINLAQKNLDLATEALNQATIVAPFEGIIIKVYPKAGDYLGAPSQSANPVIYMIDPSTMQLEINVNELDMPLVKMNQEASVIINAFPNTSINGSVTDISPSPINSGGVYYSITVSFSAPENLNVQIGMNGSAGLMVK
jgi:HlyD family secretion protein